MSNYTFQQLKDLWTQVGGNPLYANMAAAIALAESSGNPNSTNANGNGTTDRGLWQINSIHGSQSTYDPIANAKAAVAISNNGTNWRPWCTAWSNARCGGTFLGSGSPYQKYLPSGSSTGGSGGPSSSAPAPSTSSPTGSSSQGTSATPAGLGSDALHFLGLPSGSDITGIFNAVGKDLWFGVVAFFGAVLALVGLGVILLQTKPGRVAATVASKVV